MSDIFKDVKKIWDRLFDHRAFLGGEVTFLLQEFEQKRGDQEVDKLFHVIENIAEVKDTGISHFKQIGKENLYKANKELRLALNACDKFNNLEETYIQDNTIEEQRNQRKIVWDKFMDGITQRYSDINSKYEDKEKEIVNYYKIIEEKLLI